MAFEGIVYGKHIYHTIEGLLIILMDFLTNIDYICNYGYYKDRMYI